MSVRTMLQRRGPCLPLAYPKSLLHTSRIVLENASTTSQKKAAFPASFVLPTAVPKISSMASEESVHRRNILGLLEALNLPQVEYAFAYGSGVFSQTAKSKSTDGKPPMIDLVIAVKDPAHWHAMNMKKNPDHYPWWTRWLGALTMRSVQNWGAVKGDIVKYGIIDTNKLCDDLLYWNTLYASGRMHKPTARLFDATKDRVPRAEQANLASALRTALLLLPEEFTEKELYYAVSSLSYMGDFRMSVPGGENQNKIRNIVENQQLWFRVMYSALLTRLGFVSVTQHENTFYMKQDKSPAMRAVVAANLPQTLRMRIVKHFLSKPGLHPILAKLKDEDPEMLMPIRPSGFSKLGDTELTPEVLDKMLEDDRNSLPKKATSFWLTVVQQPSFEKVLKSEVSKIVSEPARKQSLKGLYTAGVGRSLRYLWSKLSKYRQGKKEQK
ncbi:hypothetical protein Malapachy_2150 [Malassezia pachydermatis]|uniref:Phosphatidate cytidylyltransferase, mitochondrial n=1 Tax=Malassezia pachydermatis TaxID=77020 RepID=A0A0M8MP18_9BASI|nr:hypothetical protein Malapachy_2150 [Malassezia pachydermatis]KOS15438.1 hypothetical protein Malapachy_2150 [Malassezia pachydermatis]